MADMALSSPRRRSRNPLQRLRQDAPFFFLAALVVVVDQVTKAIVRGNLALGESWPSESWLVKITHVTNTGAAFGVLQGQDAFLTVTAVVGMAAIIFYYAFPPTEHPLVRLSLGLLLGGAIGNLIDRVRFGEVTDFIHFPHYPSFNVADSCITVGIIIIAGYFLLIEGREDPRERKAEAGDA